MPYFITLQDISISELSFPTGRKVKYANFPQRKIYIPTVFQSHAHYKQIFTAALTGTVNNLFRNYYKLSVGFDILIFF